VQDLTERQAELLAFICRFVDTEGYPPTLREMAAHLKVDVSTVFEHLEALAKKRAVIRAPGIPRGIKVLTPQH
jgi:repressor LexA